MMIGSAIGNNVEAQMDSITRALDSMSIDRSERHGDKAILDTFKATPTLKAAIEYEHYRNIIYAMIKSRNNLAIFATDDERRGYTAAYAPICALTYRHLFLFFWSYLSSIFLNAGRVVCLGGGTGGKLVGIIQAKIELMRKSARLSNLHLILVDEMKYSPLLNEIMLKLEKDNSTFTDRLSAEFYRGSIIGRDGAGLLGDGGLRWDQILGPATDLVLAGFVIEELYQRNPKDAREALQRIAAKMKSGAHLLIMDSWTAGRMRGLMEEGHCGNGWTKPLGVYVE